MTTTLPPTATAARTNRLIADLRDKGQLTPEIEYTLNLRAINQIRATQGKKPLKSYTPTTAPKTVKAQPTFTPAAQSKFGLGPEATAALEAISKPLPAATAKSCSDLDALQAKLEACEDRSSKEARQIRKAIRTLKDKLGIAR